MMKSHCGFQPAVSNSGRRSSVTVALTFLVIFGCYLYSADAASQQYSQNKRHVEEQKCPITGRPTSFCAIKL